jgi:uncharacterized protein YxjI
MKFLLVLGLLLVSPLALADCPALAIPATVQLQEHLLSIGTDFTISASGKTFGQVTEKVLNLGTTFELVDSSGKIIAKAHKEIFTLGTKIRIEDCQGQPLGSIEAEFMQNFFTLYSRYTLKSGSGQTIGQSQKVALMATSFELSSTQGLAVRISRPWLSLTDQWTVEITSPDIDPRLALFLAAFATAEGHHHSSHGHGK